MYTRLADPTENYERAAFTTFLRRRYRAHSVHMQVTSVYLKLNETQRAANALSTILVRWPVRIA